VTTRVSGLRRLGKYELVAKIGEGGMAEVHLARQRGPRQFEKIVVVKTVRPSLASRPEIATMLLEEARIAALLKHPHVVDIYDLGEEDGTFFIAMEYLEGESLAAILKVSRAGTRLDPFSTARIVADCAAGLHAAHELRSLAGDPLELVHQDVTPGNVIVLYSGQVKLVDFGVAKVRTSVDDGMVKGKTGYLAPELLTGAPADRRSDVWSLGVVLWEALTLRRLFAGRTEEEAIAKIQAAEVPPPSALAPMVPRELDEVCFFALARDPARRYRTAQAMQADLQQILRHASWSGGGEPIARFMRSTFAERIAARRELLRELAVAKRARATTVERLQKIQDDGSTPGAVVEVVGSHGTSSRPHRLPLPAPVTPPPVVNATDQAMVALVDDDLDIAVIDADAPIAPAATLRPERAPAPPPVAAEGTPVGAAPTVKLPTLRRRVAIVAIVGGALVGAIGAALALGVEVPGRSPSAATAATDPAAADITEDSAQIAANRHPQATPVVAPPQEPEPEPEPDPDPEPVVEPEPTDDDDDRRKRRRDKDKDKDRDRERRERRERDRDRRDRDRPGNDVRVEAPPPPDTGGGVAPTKAATAKSLYKEGLKKFVAGDTEGAIALFDKSKAKDSGYAPTYRGLGMAYEKRGDRKRAAKAFETYLRLAPNASDAASIRTRLERLR
jgi:eukaryotic-like serine/threonine-protein kinase